MFVCTVQIPQRFMTVNGLSPLAAAIKLLAFGAFIPIGSSLAAALMGKPKIPACWVISIGVILQIVGIVLLSRISTATHIDQSQYGFQILVGTGIGFQNAALTLLVPYVMDKRDLGKPTHATEISELTLRSHRLSCNISVPYARRTHWHINSNCSIHTFHSKRTAALPCSRVG